MWNSSELQYLQDNYKLGAKHCVETLGKTLPAVYHKAGRLGLKSTYGKKKTTEEYAQEIIHIAVPLEPYKNAKSAILHKFIPCGHEWSISPTNILSGRSCPKCPGKSPGFRTDIPASLYCVKFEYEDIHYYKIGITNKDAKKRYIQEWAKFKMELEWEIFFDTGKEAKRVEQQLLKDNECYKINTGALISGNTETVSVYVSKPNGIK